MLKTFNIKYTFTHMNITHGCSLYVTTVNQINGEQDRKKSLGPANSYTHHLWQTFDFFALMEASNKSIHKVAVLI